MMRSAMSVLFLKAHVSGYARADGTYVKPHEDKRTSKHSAGLYDTGGMTQEQARGLVRGEAERLRDMMAKRGLDAKVEHSGSAAGPSSYISAFDPDTQLSWRDIRVSNHSKGAFNSTLVSNVAGDEDFSRLLDQMERHRAEARSKPGYVSLVDRQKEQVRSQEEGAKARAARREEALALKDQQAAGESLTGRERRTISWYEHEVKAGRLEKSHAAWTPPTPAQAEAGNYKKPRVQWHGLEIAIENPAGSVREGKGWRTKMKYDYGYICRSEAVDGDEVDVYLGPDLDTAKTVYVVHQRKYGDWKKYDEDKAMLGFPNEAAARAAYLAHYDDPRFLGPITAMPVEEFVEKARKTYEKPAMIKAILFLKSDKLSASMREKIGTVGSKKREDEPEDVFLEPGSRKYPVKVKRDGAWEYSPKLLEAAAARARMQGRDDLAKRADEIRAGL